MVNNRQKQTMKNKNFFLAIAMFALMTAGSFLFCAFTMPEHNVVSNCPEVNDDCEWTLIASRVAYCSGVDEEKGVCKGTDGRVFRNNSGQLVITIGCSSDCPKSCTDYYGLAYTTKHEGYNYRFYKDNQYYYIYVNVPSRRVVTRQ